MCALLVYQCLIVPTNENVQMKQASAATFQNIELARNSLGINAEVGMELVQVKPATCHELRNKITQKLLISLYSSAVLFMFIKFVLLLFWSLEETFAMDEVTEDEDVKVEENEIKVEILEEEHDEARMCDVCSAVCKSVRALQKHKKVKHDTRQCPECGISVEGMDKLRYHKSLITNYKFQIS